MNEKSKKLLKVALVATILLGVLGGIIAVIENCNKEELNEGVKEENVTDNNVTNETDEANATGTSEVLNNYVVEGEKVQNFEKNTPEKVFNDKMSTDNNNGGRYKNSSY